MSSVSVEAFWARIFTDVKLQRRFRKSPKQEASRAGLSEQECAEVMKVNWDDLETACRSFAGKREARQKREAGRMFRRVRMWIARFARK